MKFCSFYMCTVHSDLFETKKLSYLFSGKYLLVLTISVLLILQVRDIIFYAGKIYDGSFQGGFEELETFLAP